MRSFVTFVSKISHDYQMHRESIENIEISENRPKVSFLRRLCRDCIESHRARKRSATAGLPSAGLYETLTWLPGL